MIEIKLPKKLKIVANEGFLVVWHKGEDDMVYHNVPSISRARIIARRISKEGKEVHVLNLALLNWCNHCESYMQTKWKDFKDSGESRLVCVECDHEVHWIADEMGTPY